MTAQCTDNGQCYTFFGVTSREPRPQNPCCWIVWLEPLRGEQDGPRTVQVHSNFDSGAQERKKKKKMMMMMIEKAHFGGFFYMERPSQVLSCALVVECKPVEEILSMWLFWQIRFSVIRHS